MGYAGYVKVMRRGDVLDISGAQVWVCPLGIAVRQQSEGHLHTRTPLHPGRRGDSRWALIWEYKGHSGLVTYLWDLGKLPSSVHTGFLHCRMMRAIN